MSSFVLRFSFFLALVLALLTGVANESCAVTPVWITGTGGYSTYKMGYVNRDIGAFNAAYALSMDEVNGGLAYGLQVGMDVAPNVGLSVALERLSAFTEVSFWGGSRRFNLAANALFGSVHYSLPSYGPARLNVAAGIGLISAAGQLKVATTGSGTNVGDVTGNGFLLQGQVGGEYSVAPRVFLVTSAGYRMAKINGYEVDGDVVRNTDGSEESLDYGGFIFRLGLKLALTR